MIFSKDNKIMKATWHQSDCLDRISDLPDSVILHILSFLHIEDVIRTSFISRRWRYLWTSAPTLDINDLVFTHEINFIRFVNSVLHRRNNSGIEKFSLTFGAHGYNTFQVQLWIAAQTWISAAVSHNVRELMVYYYKGKLFDLPICLYTCTSLTVLRLNLNNSTIKIPSSIHLPFLNTLHLASVTFSDNNLTQKLFSNCPLLKEVVLEDVYLGDLTVLHICSPSLERLTLSFPMVLGSNTLLEHEIRISTARLLSLEYTGCMSQNICLENGSLLVDVAIYINFDRTINMTLGDRLRNFMRALSNAKILTLSPSIILILCAASHISERLPMFCNLNRLELIVSSYIDDIREITRFLHRAPNLEFLSIKFIPITREESFEFEPTEKCFGCIVDHLKDVKIREFAGRKYEAWFVKLLLGNASVLERMTIVPTTHLSKNSNLWLKIIQEIRHHPRGSTSCEVFFP